MADYSYCETESEAAAERAFDDSLGTDPAQELADAVAHYGGRVLEPADLADELGFAVGGDSDVTG